MRDHLLIMEKSLYDMLCIHPLATPAEVHKAYRRLARKMHPDAHPNVSNERRTQIEEAMAELNYAWAVLGDPTLRAQYNRDIGIQEVLDDVPKWVAPPPPSGFDYYQPGFLTSFARLTDEIHRALSLVPLGNDFSSLRALWPDGVWRMIAHNQRITDDQLAHIAGLTSLVHLDLANTSITDKGLEHLTGLRNLNHLELSRTRVTDAGLIHISRITSIEALTLYGTGVTDLGLSYLPSLQKLDYLDLRGTEIRGPGLTSLRPIQDLDVLLLPYGIPKHFRVELRDALPHLEIRH